jgi:hypothetical protein
LYFQKHFQIAAAVFTRAEGKALRDSIFPVSKIIELERHPSSAVVFSIPHRCFGAERLQGNMRLVV